MHKISVLIPVYNKEKYISDTLFTVDRQITDNKFSIEVVLVDDCSTDNSFTNINAHVWKNITDVKISSTPTNSGPATALNLALSLASGDYIVPLDADDLLTRYSLLQRYKSLQEKASWVSGNELAIEGNGKYIAGREFTKKTNPQNSEELVYSLLNGDFFIPASSLMVKKEALDGFTWNTELISIQDLWLNLHLAMKGCELTVINDYVALYRYHEASSDNSLLQVSMRNGQHFKDFLYLRELLANKLTEKQLQGVDSWIDRLKKEEAN